MNKQEINEIKKQLTYDRCTISRICGCYVDGEKNIKSTFKESFLSLPEEQGYKYFDLLKHTLSGTVGKNLMTLDFPLEQEHPDGTQAFLLKLRNSKLEDDELLTEFYERIIATYVSAENYYIILTHAMYDIPKKGTDQLVVYDGSEDVYEYLLCSICPVKLDKAALYFNPASEQMEERIRDRIVSNPADGFLFPAFNDRNTDIHSILYYIKKPEELQADMIDKVFGCRQPITAAGQMDSFTDLLIDTLEDECNFETVKEIHDTIYTMIQENAEDPEPLSLDKPDVQKVFEQSGVSNEKLAHFEHAYEEAMIRPEEPVQAENLLNTRSFSVKMPDVSIKVSPERTSLIHQEMVDGRQCLVIDLTDSVEVNGIPVKVR